MCPDKCDVVVTINDGKNHKSRPGSRFPLEEEYAKEEQWHQRLFILKRGSEHH